MMFRRMMVLAAFLVVMVMISNGRAFAYVEYCGARAAVVPIAGSSETPAEEYALLLSAGTPRNVSGSVTMETTSGWYSLPFKDVVLDKRAFRYRSPTAEFTRNESVSSYLYLRFPSAVTVQNAFVATSTVTGEHEMGWSTAPRACPAYDVTKRQTEALKRNDIVALNPIPSPSPAAPGVSILTPAKIATPGAPDCKEAAKDASVSKPVPPHWPMGYRITMPYESLVEVAVAKDGSLDDAWIYAPSGIRAFDDAAIEAARASTYQPARSFCEPVPGLYLFRAVFKPN